MPAQMLTIFLALELADEYDMRAWIEALLDPSPIPKGTHDPSKKISTPPRFMLARPSDSPERPSLPPPVEPMSTRKRSLRSASPSKAAAPAGRKIATPKRRTGRRTGSSNLGTSVESSQAASQSVEPDSVNGDSMPPAQPTIQEEDESADEDAVKVEITNTVEEGIDGGEPTTTTHVTIETPANHPDLKVPADPQAYLDQAKAAIAEANRMTAGRAAGKKRKAVEMLQDDEADETKAVEEGSSSSTLREDQPNKRLRLTETELRKEKIKRRATMGIAISLGVG